MIKEAFLAPLILKSYLSLLLVICTCLFVSLTWAQEGSGSVNQASNIVAPLAFLESELIPKDGVAGQKRILQIRLYTKSWLRKAPKYPDLLVDGTVVLTPDAFGVNSTAERDGEQYTVQTKEYQLFPRRAGAFIVPPFSLRFSIAGEDGLSLINTELKSDILGFKVSPLASSRITLDDNKTSDGRAFELVGRELVLEQNWAVLADDRPLRAGDAYGREIKLSINDSLAMFIPPFNQFMPVFSKSANGDSYRIEGGRAFQTLDKVDDESNRGDSTALRVESWHYVFEKPGLYRLPDVTLHWWDLNSEQWNVEVAQGKEIEVLPSLLSEKNASGSAYRLSTVVLFIIFIVMLAVLFFILFTKVSLLNTINSGLNFVAAIVKKFLRRMGFPFDKLNFWRVERARWRALEEALHGQNEAKMATLLYLWIDVWRECSVDESPEEGAARSGEPLCVLDFCIDDNPVAFNRVEVLLSKLYQASGRLSSDDFDKLMLACGECRQQLRRTHRSNKYRLQGAIKNFNRDSICSRSLNP